MLKVNRTILEMVVKEKGGVRKLASEAGLSPQYVYKVLKNDISVGRKFVRALKGVTNLPFSALFYYSDSE